MSAPILDAALKQIEGDLARVPDGVSKQLIIAADDKGATLGWAFRTQDGWKLSASVEQRFAKQRPNARLSLAKEWP